MPGVAWAALSCVLVRLFIREEIWTWEREARVARLIAHVRRVAGDRYRGLPPGLQRRISATIHGETQVQEAARARLREWRAARTEISGEGEVVQGTVLRPHRAFMVHTFDAWAHVNRLERLTLGVLRDAGIEVISLPNQSFPSLVVADEEWDSAWKALASAEATRRLWFRQPAGRALPIGPLASGPSAPVCEVFQHLVAPNGRPFGSEDIFIEIQRWQRLDREDRPRTDGGTHPIGTWLAPGQSNSFAAYLSPDTRRALTASDGWLPAIDAVREPVDFVYTWVDGSDPKWLTKRARFAGAAEATVDGLIAARYRSRDELRYSLRSVEMFAGWFNKVYIVTDGQVPDWLDLDHPRVVVVDHHDIFDPADLPVFNSHAIESRLHHIEGLSERFIYLNDDVFFGRPVVPEVFFTGSGQTKFFPSKALIDPGPPTSADVSVSSAAKNNRTLIERSLGRTFTTKLKHTPHAHSRSLLEEMENRYPEVFRANVAARFRTHRDHAVLSGLAQRYGHVTGRAAPGHIIYNYVDVSRPGLDGVLAHWLRHRQYDSFCLNDTGAHAASEAVDAAIRRFLQDYFPFASSFETSIDGEGLA